MAVVNSLRTMSSSSTVPNLLHSCLLVPKREKIWSNGSQVNYIKEIKVLITCHAWMKKKGSDLDSDCVLK